MNLPMREIGASNPLSPAKSMLAASFLNLCKRYQALEPAEWHSPYGDVALFERRGTEKPYSIV